MEILGPSLQELFDFCEENWNFKTIFWVASQMIQRMETFHQKNFIHRDIKPENFLIGAGKKQNVLYVIDFGLSKRFKDPKTNNHVEHTEKGNLIGTCRYLSLNAHLRYEQSRRDDLESVGFVLIYFFNKGFLPWMKAEHLKDVQKSRLMQLKIKQESTIEQLTKDLPQCIQTYMRYCRNIDFK